jgi:hypothetical protein
VEGRQDGTFTSAVAHFRVIQIQTIHSTLSRMDLNRVLVGQTICKLHEFVRAYPCVALHLRDASGELEAVHLSRSWPDTPRFLDTLLILAEREARACRLRYDERDFPEGEVWRAYGSTADMLDALTSLPPPNTRTMLLLPPSSDLWIPPAPRHPLLPPRTTVR